MYAYAEQHRGKTLGLGKVLLIGAAVAVVIAARDIATKSPVSPAMDIAPDANRDHQYYEQLLGKWVSFDSQKEAVEFFPDGTVRIVNDWRQFSETGDWRFLPNHPDQLRIILRGYRPGIGPMEMRFALKQGDLTLRLADRDILYRRTQ